MDEMFEELALVADTFLEAELARVEALTARLLEEASAEEIERNEMTWWLLIIHSILDDVVERLPLDRRRLIIERGMNVTGGYVPVEEIVGRSYARIDLLAASMRARVAEGKVGGLLGEDLLNAIEQALGRSISEFIRDLDTSMTMYDRLYMQAIANGMEKRLWEYAGPRDPKNRDFCREVLDARRAYTDEGVDQLNEHPSLHAYVPPNVRTLCGGYGCRHVFVPVTEAQAKKEGLEWDGK
jgi:hypothetical protein